MIGGLMLLSAVGAMVLIAWWSLPRDDADADPATGLFALRSWSGRTVERKHDTANRRNRRPVAKTGANATAKETAKPNGKRDRRPDPSTRRRRP